MLRYDIKAKTAPVSLLHQKGRKISVHFTETPLVQVRKAWLPSTTLITTCSTRPAIPRKPTSAESWAASIVRSSMPPLQFPTPTGARPRSINPNAWANPATPTMTATAIRQAFSTAPSTVRTPAS